MAAPRTPNPTPEDVLDIHLPLVGERVDEALQEIVLRLKQDLPGVIALRNQRNGWSTPAKAIPLPDKDGYDVAPANLTNEHINCVLVGISTETMQHGLGHAFKNSVEVVIYSVDKVSISSMQIIQHWRRAALCRAVMHAYLKGCVNEEGHTCWRKLAPTGYSMIPTEWKGFSGMGCTFTMTIPPTTASTT